MKIILIMTAAMVISVVIFLSFAIYYGSSTDDVNYRLSKDVVPSSYNITIKPYFLPEDGEKRFTFDAETSVVIEPLEPNISTFALHAEYLNFSEIEIRSGVGKRVKFSKQYDELTNKLIFNLEKNLVQFDNYSIGFKYSGRIFTDNEGLFRSSYIDVDQNEKLMLVTQLQRIHARKLFPCFDEPGFKAFFDIHVNRPKNYRSFANTRLSSTSVDSNDENRYIDHFETTPYMSTYLVVMMISEFVSRTEGTISMISRPEFSYKTIMSQEIAHKVLNGYNDLFGIPYTILGNPILQKVSLPKFIHNGMENWGLIVYRDEVIVYEDNKTDLNGMQFSAALISHETSHSWFGNSLTFEWWGYFWLNEAFARYYQYFFTHKLFPQYQMDKQFTVDQMHSIFDIDASNKTQPLSEPNVSSPAEIARKFSSITYVKGASIVRMISHAMSESQFVMAIRDYIKSNLSSSVKPSDLLKFLKKYWPPLPSVDVELFFQDWTEKVGFPFVFIRLSKTNSEVTIQQSRYIFYSNDGSDPSLRYTIPLTYTTNTENDFNNTFPKIYFNRDQQFVVLNFTQPIEWIIFNIQQTGYYRVLYDINLCYRLHQSLLKNGYSNIHELNRAQFVDDLFAFGRTGFYRYDIVFEWLDYLRTEIHYTPWKAAIKGFTFVGQFMTPLEHNNLGKYILRATEKVYASLGLSGKSQDSTLDVYNRNQIITLNCKYGRRGCIRETESLLKGYLYNGTMIPVDIRATVYCSGMRDAPEDDFQKLLKRFKVETVPREKLRMRNGLGCVRNSKNIERFFELALTDEVIPKEEKVDAISLLFKENPENIWPVYKLLTGRLQDLAKSLGWSQSAELIGKIATLFTTIEQRTEFYEFIAANRKSFGYSSSVLLIALKQLDYNLKWSKTHLVVLNQYLENKFG